MYLCVMYIYIYIDHDFATIFQLNFRTIPTVLYISFFILFLLLQYNRSTYEKEVWTVMGNNSTNSNKTNSHLSSQFAGYKNMPRDMTLEIKTLAWDRHINMVGENRLMGLQLLSIIASPSAINTYTSDENLHYIYI